MEQAVKTVTDLLSLGGPVVVLLLIISVFALALVLLKMWQFAQARVGRHGAGRRALHHWKSRNKVAAKKDVAGKIGLVDRCVSAALYGLESRDLSKQCIEEAVHVIASGGLHQLQKGFRALDAIAQIAPLLGLFGTVLGMIEAFQKLQVAGNAVDPSILAGGIWVALLTTAIGLAVAMPVSLALTWFESQVNNEKAAIENIVGGLLNDIPTQAKLEPLSVPGALANAY